MATGSGAQYASIVKSSLASARPTYQKPEETQRDVMQVFASFKDLRPRMDSYVFNDGQNKNLLCIDGTIPVYYKGISYNIPICIWVMDTHPYNPPLCFVKPTKEMMIKPSKFVDPNGKVYLPYLHDWKYPSSDLVGLIQVMAAVFGDCSPVFSRAAAQSNPARTSYPPAGHQPAASQPPYPAGGGYNMPMPMPTPQGSSQPGFNANYPPSSSYQPPAQYPGSYPNAGQYQGSSQPPSYPYPPSQPPQGGQAYPTTSDLPTGTSHKNSEISEDDIKASIRSAVEDKLKRRLQDTYDGLQAEIDSLAVTKEKLKTGQQKLEDIISKLETEQVDLEKDIHLLKQKDEEIRLALSKLDGQDQMDIDEAIIPTTPLYKQLLNLFAEEMTIEDTYYYLMEALRKNTIELEAFLKHVRELSRKQFLLRAHIQKVRQTAGLRDLVM
ncbi:tumor susceptibility gene 101 protein-like [Asterias rubens]|uniref:tumor susceptibility gene 101 protein-like n=1 Tax=Asterias rubens TaxID=7604 RepID=UPI00145511B7|nr:tumor susceptibility gene 101 protein-like [Asterias rubens]